MKKRGRKSNAEKIELKKQQKILKKYITEVKEKSKCHICGEDRWWVLDFHHVKNKIMSIPEMARNGCSLDDLKNEIEKCIIVCANCHRDIHHNIQKNNEKML